MIKEIVEREKDRKKEVGKKGKNEHVFKVNCFRPQHIFFSFEQPTEHCIGTTCTLTALNSVLMPLSFG